MNDPLPWLILFLPLLSAVLITLFTLKNPRFSAILSVGAVFVSLLLSINLFGNSMADAPPHDISLNWLKVGQLSIHFGMHFDPMSLLMLLIVTGVGSAIHLYSVAYMKGDRCVGRFFAGLSLFTFAMLGVVLSDNFLEMFIFWELVGVCSYLLIGFWYERAGGGGRGQKAFLTNRLGDFGFFTGIILVWAVTGTLNFAGAHTQMLNNPEIFDTAATGVGLLIFCGAVGKSAQFPLHVWLPDAMEGPTPVSALIHAATMVAAGVYMLCRVFFIFNPSALDVIAWIGGLTALMSALIAVPARRHQTHSGLLDAVAIGLHGDGGRVEPSAGGDVSSGHPCLFQGALVFGRRFGHSRPQPRAEHLENGPVEGKNAGDILDISGRHPGALRRLALERFLQQGCHFGGGL